ncbi:DNA-directed RNA polymerase subunit delta [Aerococcus urinae]|uniref:Probable DNA-directed RNA polymerase subunit delta n=1 Tax=Aerococcus urinae TaxID=1376 RepID=A0A109REQ8_9LACT|nr:DNA-directed RNA polymerase subunit delta [Aerococcus urinae]AMB96309.1 DNA-directed RNA polymerase subunit delta [Aerococcus urinae]MCY3032324.1 DNA-directed RNA polymerase subunit delta [Aerococcus urinae]MCY3037829.1 DNA-directed RNA polymerase subunit delta [Aerococcus urinae]MCY3044370.1 DNA-directed RNA polymerase subunit delta [Aerococcus urinae]MCY3045504.1 DNA-directed RNA polymerase subunit delta [Aerococcus urinae]
MNLQRLDHQNKEELSLLEVAYEILAESNEVYDFNQLLAAVQEYLDLTDDQVAQRMVTFYTELNTDGSFISLGENRWGLRAWYPIDSINEAIVSSMDDEDIKEKHKTSRRKKVNVFDEGNEDMIDYNADDPEDVDAYEEDFDDEDYDEADYDDVDVDDDDEDSDENDELKDYQSDLDELGDDETEDDLEDGLEGDLTILDDEDLEDEEEDDHDF